MALSFNVQIHPAHIHFGADGVSQVPQLAEALGCERLLILSTPNQAGTARAVSDVLGSVCVGVHAQAVMHTPVEITDNAVKAVTEHRADGLLAIGGGSTIGLGKAIAYRLDLPQIVIPTTYAGSEVTPILGQTENGVKTTLRSARVLPDAVIYDPVMTHTLPVAMSVNSGINAIAHAAEALYARDRNPVSTLMAIEGATALFNALPAIADDPANAEAREQALYGSWLCGTVLGTVGMALHHKLCHTLGGLFNLPHAETHCVVLPHAVAYNAEAVPALLQPIADVLHAHTPGDGLYEYSKRLGAPTSLQALGMPESGIVQAAEQVLANPYWNPRSLEPDGIEQLIRNAYHGVSPG